MDRPFWRRRSHAPSRSTCSILATMCVLVCAMTIVAVALPDPDPVNAAGDTPYIGLWTTGSNDEAATVEDLGMGWARVSLPWFLIEPTAGEYRWPNFDDMMATMAADGRRQL